MVRFGSLLIALLSLVSTAQADVPAQVELNLGTSKTYSFEVTSQKADTIKFTVDRSQLDKVKGGEKVVIEVNPAEAALKAGETVNVEFTVTVPTGSPSFEPVKVALDSKCSAGKVHVGETMLSVKAVYEVFIKEGETENWSVPKNASLNFARHSKGVLVRFLNLDKTKSHQVHSGGAIPHSDAPLAPANNDGPVGSYEYTVVPSANVLKAGVYCHDHEGFGSQRMLNFNVPESELSK